MHIQINFLDNNSEYYINRRVCVKTFQSQILFTYIIITGKKLGRTSSISSFREQGSEYGFSALWNSLDNLLG